MTSASDIDLIARLDDLIKQATTERSHYYTASLLLECRARLVDLTKADKKTSNLKRWSKPYGEVAS